MDNLWRSCAKLRELIEISFVVVSVHVPQRGRGWMDFFCPIGLNGLLSVLSKQKCIRLVSEKLTMFPYEQNISGTVIFLS